MTPTNPPNPKTPGRRAFLTSMAAAPALLSFDIAHAQAQSDGAAHSSFDPWVEVHADNFRHNIEAISRRVDGRPIMAVIKNNA